MKRYFSLVMVLLGASLPALSAVLPAEELLPGDTLLVLSVPDFNRARDIYAESPQGQFWRDPAMKPFKDKFVSKFKSKFLAPLERELDIKLTDYTDLAQGQLTLALIGNGWGSEGDSKPASIFLIDTRDKSEQLKQRLAEIRQKWVDSGKDFKTERIRDVEFSVLIASSGDLFEALSKLTGDADDAEAETDEDADEEKPTEIYLGQAESLFIMGSEPAVIEKVLIRLSGGLVPSLREQAAFEANFNAMFRDAPLFGWANSGRILETFQRQAAEEAGGQEPNLFSLRPEKIMEATGVLGLRTVAFKYDHSPDGGLFHLLLGAPESRRTGLFKILAAEQKDARPPVFVPADVVKFQRSRMDGQKAWAALESMLTAISPQMMGGFNFMLDTAEAAVKQTDPSFDLRKNLIGNLGDDYLVYQKLPREKTLTGLNSPPTLYLIGSPNADQFAGALKSIFMLIGGAGGTPEEREFLGRTIFTVKLPTPPTGDGSTPKPRTLSYAASGGYVGISADVALLEEYLRSSDSTAKPLREVAGLNEAAQKVGGMGTGFFGYSDQRESMRVAFEALKQDAASESMVNFMIQSNLIMGTGDTIEDWADFTLLPEFTQVAKYFGFSVYTWNATPEGLHMKMFAPTPPEMRQ